MIRSAILVIFLFLVVTGCGNDEVKEPPPKYFDQLNAKERVDIWEDYDSKLVTQIHAQSDSIFMKRYGISNRWSLGNWMIDTTYYDERQTIRDSIDSRVRKELVSKYDVENVFVIDSVISLAFRQSW